MSWGEQRTPWTALNSVQVILILLLASALCAVCTARALGDETPQFSCKAYGRTVECVATDFGGRAIKWAALTEKEPSYFAYGGRMNPKFIFVISPKELTTIQLYVQGLDEPLTAYAKWDGKKVYFSERRKDLE